MLCFIVNTAKIDPLRNCELRKGSFLGICHGFYRRLFLSSHIRIMYQKKLDTMPASTEITKDKLCSLLFTSPRKSSENRQFCYIIKPSACQ